MDAAQRAAAITGLAERLGPALLRVTIAAVCMVVFGVGVRGLYQWALTSPVFALKTVHFAGLHHATESDLSKRAGLVLGMNVLQLDPELAEHALASNPWLKSVSVRRRFPASIEVDVVERTPVAWVSLGDLYLVDADGEPFKRVQPGEPLDLPLISGVDRDAYTATPRAMAARLREAMGVVSEFESAEQSLGRVSEIRADATGFTLFSSSGLEVHLGEGAPAEELARLARVASELSKRGLVAQVIRLDNRVRPGWVTVKLSQSGTGR